MEIEAALKANIALLDKLTMQIMDYATQANEAIKKGKELEAVGTLCYIQQDMADADALLKAIFAINRSRRP